MPSPKHSPMIKEDLSPEEKEYEDPLSIEVTPVIDPVMEE
jgi:hypothetical protein